MEKKKNQGHDAGSLDENGQKISKMENQQKRNKSFDFNSFETKTKHRQVKYVCVCLCGHFLFFRYITCFPISHDMRFISTL